MTLILRKCKKDGYSSHNFYYGNTGDIVTAPDWNPAPECGNGLHGLKEGNGDWSLLEGSDWLVIEANNEDIVDIDGNKCKFRTGKILFRGTTEELRNSEFPNKLELNQDGAYCWARYIGNHDIMLKKIVNSEYSYLWARDVGNRDIMINRIKNGNYAYCWAKNIGDKDIMIDKINDSRSAFFWAKYIGDQDIMINRIADSEWAFQWAKEIGNHDVMIHKINDSEEAYWWARFIGNEDVMKPKVVTKDWIKKWNETFPHKKIEV